MKRLFSLFAFVSSMTLAASGLAASLVPTPKSFSPNAGDYAICVAKQGTIETEIKYTEYGSSELTLGDVYMYVTAHAVGNEVYAHASVMQNLGADGVYTEDIGSGSVLLEKGQGTHMLSYYKAGKPRFSILCTRK